MRSILAIHDVPSKSALAMLALREPKRPLFPQVKNSSRFLSARDVARNVRTLLAETGKFHPEQIERVKGGALAPSRIRDLGCRGRSPGDPNR